MRKVIRGEIVTPFEQFTGEVVVDGATISGVVEGVSGASDAEELSFPDCYVCPGFVDIHVHGASGSDILDCSPSAIESMSEFLVTRGVTSYLGTTTTAPMDMMSRAVEISYAYADAEPRDGTVSPALAFRGLHLEGPHVSMSKLGAQDGESVLTATASRIPELVRRFPGLIKTVTLAPEVVGAEALVRTLVSQGVHVSAGHTEASFDLAKNAFSWGIDRVTHLFNAMLPIHHRDPGLVTAALTDSGVFVELICDGVHVHPAVVKMVAGLKGPERVCLITDSMRATGLGDGTYTLGRLVVTVEGKSARLAGGALAGSVLTMDQAVRNVASIAQMSVKDAVMMATHTPATAVGLGRQIGSLQPGRSADIVVLDKDLQVQMTMIRGQEVYRPGLRTTLSPCLDSMSSNPFCHSPSGSS